MAAKAVADAGAIRSEFYLDETALECEWPCTWRLPGQSFKLSDSL